MTTRTTLFATSALLVAACLLLNLANANDVLRLRSEVTSEDGDPLSAPVNISFELSETTVVPDTTNGKLPENKVHQYVKSAMTVDTDGLNRIELKLKNGRTVRFEFRVQQ